MHELVTYCHFCVLLHKSPYSRTLSVRYYTMSSGPSRPGSPPIPDLDEWSGSESGGLASKPVETTRGAGDSERGALADTEHDVKDEAAENVNTCLQLLDVEFHIDCYGLQ